MEETKNESLDEQKDLAKSGEVKPRKSDVAKCHSKDFSKPKTATTAMSSGEDEGELSQKCSWSETEELRSEDRFWFLGEQELIGEGEAGKPYRPVTEETVLVGKSDESESSSEALSNVYNKLSPYTIQWSFGIDCKVKLINLTTIESFEVFFVSCHFGIIYNYINNTMTCLPGHNYPITSTAADSTGRWLVTADAGEDTVIIIWDKRKKIPVWCLYNVFPGGVSCVQISQDARFLAAVNLGHTLKFWLWTYGREEPDGTVNVDPAFGKVKSIDFNHTNTEQFVVTAESNVVFCEWDKKTKTLQNYSPKIETPRKKLGTLRESIFLDDNHTTLTSSSQGYVVVFCDVKYTDPILVDKPGTIERNFLKAVKLHKSGITSLKLCDRIIASSSEEGIILFHDQYLRLMYFTPQLSTNQLVSISFNIDHIPCSSDPFSTEFVDNEKQLSTDEEVQQVFEYETINENENENESLENKESKEYKPTGGLFSKEKASCEILRPQDCTIDMRDFLIRDLIFLTISGKIGYWSHRRQRYKNYLYEVEAPILSISCNPNKPHLVTGNSNGQLVLYDYDLKKKLLSMQFSSAITTLKYSCLGYALMAGFQNGDLLELDSLLLSVTVKLETSKSPIEKMCFSNTDEHIAFFDQSSTVQVYMKKTVNNPWMSMGKYTSHYKPIVDILFEEQPGNPRFSRLFTIGKDRMLVEYDMKHLEENKLKVLSVIRIEQTAIPCCFTWLSDGYKHPHFLVSNDQYKLKILNPETHMCIKTTLGPTADTPINFMKIIRDPEKTPDTFKMIYTTQKHIGIRLLPLTGNPFEGMGMVAHPEKITAISISHNYKYIFTVGVNDCCILMWEVNSGSVDVASQLGGVGLEPFVSLIEGGSNSFLFREIEDFFYYAQIIHQGEDPNIDRSVSKHLALCEIPDLFRALGYFPTDYEINNLLHELKYLNYEKNGQMTTEITFEECVKAFLNHRPVNGIALHDIYNALLAIADVSDPSDIRIEKNEVYKALEERAEAMEHAEVVGYFCILLLPKDENNPIPAHMPINDFMEQVFGFDLTITEEKVREITHAFEHTN